MKLLFLDAYFEPEKTAYSHLEKDLLKGLINETNNIQIICPTPTRGINKEVRKDFKKRKFENYDDKGKVRIRRFWAPREGKITIIRAFRYFWCNLRTYQIASKIKNVDLIFSNSTPPTQGILSIMVSKKLSKDHKKKIPFVYNLQDIFPDSLVNTKLTHKGSVLWKIGRRIEDYTYKNADKIIVISDSFKRNIISKGAPENKVEVISNWIDLETTYPISRNENTLIDEFQIDPRKFLVVYAGNFGAAQGANIIIEAAEKLKNESDIQFVIFGGGTFFEDAKKKSEKMRNVFIHELLPEDRVSEVYSLGDIALITCKPGTGNAGMPSKTWSIMACNTYIIASFDTNSDLADLLKNSGAGCCVEPGDVDSLVCGIKREYLNWKTGHMHRSNSRKYVLENAAKDHCVHKYLVTFLEAVK